MFAPEPSEIVAFTNRDPLRFPASGDVVLPFGKRMARVPVHHHWASRGDQISYASVIPKAGEAPESVLRRVRARPTLNIKFCSLDEWRVATAGAQVIRIEPEPYSVWYDGDNVWKTREPVPEPLQELL